MKLYTEEQVNTMLRRARLHNQDDTEMFTNEYLIADETPIELPSDEEIDKFAQIASSVKEEKTQGEWIAYKSVIAGAKWVIEQIKQQDK